MADTLILVDFDHTLFNTTLYVQLMREHFHTAFGVDGREYMAAREQVKQCCVVVDVDRFVEILPGDSAAMHAEFIAATSRLAPRCLFDDSLDFLDRHRNHRIAVLTHGDHELQTTKLDGVGIPRSIERIISLDKKSVAAGDVIADHRAIHLFDDKAENIDDVVGAFPHTRAYFVRRPEDMPYGARLPSSPGVSVLESLADVAL